MTVGELRDALELFPDEAPVLIASGDAVRYRQQLLSGEKADISALNKRPAAVPQVWYGATDVVVQGEEGLVSHRMGLVLVVQEGTVK